MVLGFWFGGCGWVELGAGNVELTVLGFGFMVLGFRFGGVGVQARWTLGFLAFGFMVLGFRFGGVGWGGVKFHKSNATVSLAHSHPPSDNIGSMTESASTWLCVCDTCPFHNARIVLSIQSKRACMCLCDTSLRVFPKMAPTCSQDDPEIAQDCSKVAPRCPR